MTTTLASGFYEASEEVYFVADSGRIWIVASADDIGSDPREIDALPDGAISVDGLLTPEEAIGHCRRIETVSGERLIED